MRQYPHRRLIPVALIDSAQLIVLTYSTLHVTPVMTVLLIHAATPSFLCATFYLFPNRCYLLIDIGTLF